MDMFDVVKAGLGGLSGSSGQSAALNAVMALLGQGGGLEGLVQSFERQGLGLQMRIGVLQVILHTVQRLHMPLTGHVHTLGR